MGVVTVPPRDVAWHIWRVAVAAGDNGCGEAVTMPVSGGSAPLFTTCPALNTVTNTAVITIQRHPFITHHLPETPAAVSDTYHVYTTRYTIVPGNTVPDEESLKHKAPLQ